MKIKCQKNLTSHNRFYKALFGILFGFKFENLLADAGYSNELVIEYLKNTGIEGFIPNATQSRENKDALRVKSLI